jgi:membrane-bound lytic murein transglycosylase A
MPAHRSCCALLICHVLAGLVTMLATFTGPAAVTMKLERLTFTDLPGWQREDHADALQVMARSCEEMVSKGSGFARKAALSGNRKDWNKSCRMIIGQAADASPAQARQLLEDLFVPVRLNGSAGQFTGYFEPEVEGSPVQTDVYNVPVLKRPSDLVKLSAADARRLGIGYGRIHNGTAATYHTRQEIEQGKLDGQDLEIAWLKSWVDLFFMQVQGSGRVRLPDGSGLRLAYSLKSGLPYTSIGKVLIERGDMTREEMSMQALRKWLDDHPREARAVMWQNESYVFFRKLDGVDPDLGPVGAQQVPLTPFRSLAVDRSVWALGVPVWVSTTVFRNGKRQPFNALMVAQDTGSAIRGPQRGDIFFGSGDQAGLDAGLMDQPGELIALLPRPLAARLLDRYR